MKVYVDEIPKSCWECPCFKNDLEFPCGLDDGLNDYYLDEINGGVCPLQRLPSQELVILELNKKNKSSSIKDKKVRKELKKA